MISDTLFEAVRDIRRYQKELPQCYVELKDRIDDVVEQMDSLRRVLDTPPIDVTDADGHTTVAH